MIETQKKNLTTIELTEEEARLFIEFRKYQEQFKKLLDNGVFDSLNGQKIVHKSGLNIMVIETRIVKRF